MAYYEPQGWQAPMRQSSWEPSAPPSRSGTSSTAQREEPYAFASQFDEVERALDNLAKSGKLFNGVSRRESVPPMVGRPYADYDPRMMGSAIPPRHHSVSEYDGIRPHSASNLQGFYAAQRYQGRPNETEQMMQAKRRLAAQRERELRNYHQEQQYNRSLLAEMSGNKSDRSMSPAAMNEESRRELIARQHRALYGNESAALLPNGGLGDESHNLHPENQPPGTPTSTTGVARGPSPRGVDPFLGQSHHQTAPESTGQTPTGTTAPPPVGPQSPSPANNSASPPNTNQTTYGIFEANPGNQHQPRPSTSSPGSGNSDSSSRQGQSNVSVSAVGPIGSRPVPQPASGQAPNPSLSKRSTTPLPSPLSYGFSPSEVVNASSSVNPTSKPGNEIPISSTANPSVPTTATSSTVKETTPAVGLGWGNGSGVWKSKNSLGVQASVWG